MGWKTKVNLQFNFENLYSSNKKFRGLIPLKNVYDSLSDMEENEENYKNKQLINKNHILRKFWNLFMVFSIFYSNTCGIYRYVFYPFDTTSLLFLFEIFLDFSFILDIFLHFITPYYVNNKLYYDKKSIAINYIRTWLFWDVISSIPLCLVLFINYQFLIRELNYNLNFTSYEDFNNQNSNKNIIEYAILGNNKIINLEKEIASNFITCNFYYKLFRWARTIKLLKLFSHDKNTHLSNELNLNNKYKSTGYLRLTLIFIFLIHISTCFWIFLAGLDDSQILISWYKNLNNYWNMNHFDIYISSLYFNLLTICTVGYGDIVSINNNERLYNIFILLIGNLLFSFGISYLSVLFASSDILYYKYKQKLGVLDKIKKKYEVPKHLYRQIKRSIKNMYTKVHMEKFIIYDSLPLVLKQEFILSMHKKGISNLIFFKYSDKEFIISVLPLLKAHNLVKDDILVSAGSIMEEVYLVNQGILSICLDNSFNNIQISQLKRNYHFGDILIYLNEKSPYFLKCLTKATEYLTLSKSDYYKIGLTFDKIIMKILEFSCEFLENIEKTKHLIVSLFDEGKNSNQIKTLIRNINFYISKIDFENLYSNNYGNLLTLEDFFEYNDIKDIVKFSETNMNQKNFNRIFSEFLNEANYTLGSTVYKKGFLTDNHVSPNNILNKKNLDEIRFNENNSNDNIYNQKNNISLNNSKLLNNIFHKNNLSNNKTSNENSNYMDKCNIIGYSNKENYINLDMKNTKIPINNNVDKCINFTNIGLKRENKQVTFVRGQTRRIRGRESCFYRDKLKIVGNKLKSSEKLPNPSEKIIFNIKKNFQIRNSTKKIKQRYKSNSNEKLKNLYKIDIIHKKNTSKIPPKKFSIQTKDNILYEDEKQFNYNEIEIKKEEKNMEKKILNMGKSLLVNIDKNKPKKKNNNNFKRIKESNIEIEEFSFSEKDIDTLEFKDGILNNHKNLYKEYSFQKSFSEKIKKQLNNRVEDIKLINNINKINFYDKNREARKYSQSKDFSINYRRFSEINKSDIEYAVKKRRIGSNKNISSFKKNFYFYYINGKNSKISNTVTSSTKKFLIPKSSNINKENNQNKKNKNNITIVKSKETNKCFEVDKSFKIKNVYVEPKTFDSNKNFIYENIEKKKRYYKVVDSFKNYVKQIIFEFQISSNNKINANSNIVCYNLKNINNNILESYRSTDKNYKNEGKDSHRSYGDFRKGLKRCISMKEVENKFSNLNKVFKKDVNTKQNNNTENNNNYNEILDNYNKKNTEDQNFNLINKPNIRRMDNEKNSIENSFIWKYKSFSINAIPNRISLELKKIVNEKKFSKRIRNKYFFKNRSKKYFTMNSSKNGSKEISTSQINEIIERKNINDKKEKLAKNNLFTKLTDENDNTPINNSSIKRQKTFSHIKSNSYDADDINSKNDEKNIFDNNKKFKRGNSINILFGDSTLIEDKKEKIEEVKKHQLDRILTIRKFQNLKKNNNNFVIEDKNIEHKNFKKDHNFDKKKDFCINKKIEGNINLNSCNKLISVKKQKIKSDFFERSVSNKISRKKNTSLYDEMLKSNINIKLYNTPSNIPKLDFNKKSEKDFLINKNTKFLKEELVNDQIYSYEIIRGNYFINYLTQNKNKCNIFIMNGKNNIISSRQTNNLGKNITDLNNKNSRRSISNSAKCKNNSLKKIKNIKNNNNQKLNKNKDESKIHQSLTYFKNLELIDLENFKNRNIESSNKENMDNFYNNIQSNFKNNVNYLNKNNNNLNLENGIRNKLKSKLFIKDQLKNLFSHNNDDNNKASIISNNNNNNIVKINIQNNQKNTNFIKVINNNSHPDCNTGKKNNFSSINNFKLKENNNKSDSLNNQFSNGFILNKDILGNLNSEYNNNSNNLKMKNCFKQKSEKNKNFICSIEKISKEDKPHNIFDNFKDLFNKKTYEMKQTKMINNFSIFEDGFLENVKENENSILKNNTNEYSPKKKYFEINEKNKEKINKNNKVSSHIIKFKRQKDEELINSRMDKLLQLIEKGNISTKF